MTLHVGTNMTKIMEETFYSVMLWHVVYFRDHTFRLCFMYLYIHTHTFINHFRVHTFRLYIYDFIYILIYTYIYVKESKLLYTYISRSLFHISLKYETLIDLHPLNH